MKEKIENIMSGSNGSKLAILLGTVFVITVLYYFTLYSAIGADIAKLETEIDGKKGKEGLQEKVNKQRAIARKLPYFRKQVEALDAELAKALSELPDEKEVRQILEKVSDRAIGAGLEVISFKPQAEVKQEFFAENPVSLSVKGSFHEVATFFDEIGNLERIINIDYFNMKAQLENTRSRERGVEKDSSGITQLSADLTTTAFRFLDESERPQRDKKRKKRKKK